MRKPLDTIQSAATFANVSTRTISRMLASGELTAIKVRGRVRIPDLYKQLGIETEADAPRPSRNRAKAERERVAARALLSTGGG